jgi:hypothetical protein
MIKRIIFTLVPAAASIISIWKFIDELVVNNLNGDKFYFGRVVIYVVLAGLTICYLVSNIFLLTGKKAMLFKKGSKRYYNFFSRWYSEEGYITIYCKDLATWAENDKDNPGKRKVYNSLLKKSQSKQLVIFIEQKDSASDKLEKAGAKITKIPVDNSVNFSWSVRRSNDIYSIIVRNKKKDNGNKICIEEMDSFPSEAFADYLVSSANKKEVSR